LKAFLARASSNLSGVTEIDEFAVFLLPYLRYVSEITSALIAPYDHTPFWISVGTNKNDLECRIQLKVRMSHGLLADSVNTSLASLLYSCKTDEVLS